MNKKGKNKKGKISNQTLNQTEKASDKIEEALTTNKDIVEKTSELIKNVEEKPESAQEERVPEIKSEGILFSTNTNEEETPKKPKRNKGKKNIEKEDDIDINLEKDSNKNETLSTVVSKNIDTELQKDIKIVTPVVRKKKNKKQNDKQKDNEVILGNPGEELSLETVTSNIKESESVKTTQETRVDQQHLTEKVIEEEVVDNKQEVKTGKKKNKKKKTNDYERSIKEDISCTSAFQTLLDVKDEPFETKTLAGEKSDIIPLELAKSETEIFPLKNLLLEETTRSKTKEIAVSNESACVQTEIEGQINITESKTKDSKNKKCTLNYEEVVAFSDKCLLEAGSLSDEKKTIIKDIDEQVDPKSSEETISKNKAKIAKPVGKKRIENQTNLESQQDNIVHGEAKADESLVQNLLQNSESTEKINDTVGHMSTKDSQNEPVDFSIIADITSHQLKEPEELEAPNVSHKTSNKKRKKGLKIPRAPDVSFEMLESKTDSRLLHDQETDINLGLSANNQLTTIDFSPPAAERIAQVPKEDEMILCTEMLKEKGGSKSIISMASEQKGTDHDNEIKSDGENCLNSLKVVEMIPKTNQSMIMQPSAYKQKKSSSLENSTKVDEMKIEAPSVKLHNIEIISLKPEESERSDFDTVSDIAYLDSSSQQLSDGNNNSATKRVQQVTSSTQKCVEIPKDDSSVRQEEEISLPKIDKRDLKSKMIEVNQDMEDLRLSIERSIAELNLIEKQDEVVEKKFEKSECDSEQHKTKIKTDTKSDEQKGLITIVNVEKATVTHLKEPPCPERSSESNKMKNKKLVLSANHEQSIDKLAEIDKNLSNIKETNDILDNKVVDMPPEDSKILTPITELNLSLNSSTSIAEKLTETLLKFDTKGYIKPVIKDQETENRNAQVCSMLEDNDIATKSNEIETGPISPPVCPSRRDHKNKHKKKKGKQEIPVMVAQSPQSTQSITSVTTSSSISSQENKKDDKNNHKKENKNESKEKGKQQVSNIDPEYEEELSTNMAYESIENFEDALTSSVEDVNHTFEMIIKDSQQQSSPKISTLNDEKSPVTLPKNLLGHPDIPVRSSKRDYKKEKDKIPNEITAKVKLKDSVEIEKKPTKNTQTMNKLKDLKYYKVSENEEFVYKYNFRKVFLQNACHICNKILNGVRLACCYCNLVFYCGIKHKDEDWPQHQALCFAISTIGHLRGQKHIYADAKNVTGHDYRMIRMQIIVSCEKILKRRLLPWEQEALLYPRICAHIPCREWRQMKLSDCHGCGQISFCTENPDHYPKCHSRWCKSYSLYQKLVSYQQSKGRLEPKLPTKVMVEKYEIPDKINEVLAEMYEEKIDMNDIQYAALTQLATAPLTAAYCHQLCKNKESTANGYKKSTFTIHVVGAELQFEADALNKWEVFFLHLRPDIQELKVVLINSNLNPSKLPLPLLGKFKVCENCRQKKRNIVFSFQERCYADYKSSEDFEPPDIACAFNPSIQRSSIYNGKDSWPSTVNIIIKQKIPFLITAYTMIELQKDCIRIKECVDVEYNFISEPKCNNFASVRPDRNFISDDETPLLFKNCCFTIICG